MKKLLLLLFLIPNLIMADDSEKKNGLSCFSLDSSGQLSVINYTKPEETIASCILTAGSYESVTISCGPSGLAFTDR
jgi:hypothetical protein